MQNLHVIRPFLDTTQPHDRSSKRFPCRASHSLGASSLICPSHTMFRTRHHFCPIADTTAFHLCAPSFWFAPSLSCFSRAAFLQLYPRRRLVAISFGTTSLCQFHHGVIYHVLDLSCRSIAPPCRIFHLPPFFDFARHIFVLPHRYHASRTLLSYTYARADAL
jgi:hypothetical protein